MDYVIGFSYIEPTLHLRDGAYLIVVNDGLDVFLDSVCKDLLSIFTSIFISEIGLKFSLLVGCLFGLGISLIVAS